MENKSPFTANEHYLGDYREKFLNSYRQAQSNPSSVGVMEDIECSDVLFPRDPHEPALHHMASARAYFQGSC